MERRTITKNDWSIETRTDGDGATLTGYASVFYDGTPDTEYGLWEGASERIMPGAFDRAIAEDDVAALYNHKEEYMLGRTTSGTLKLHVDKRGLRYTIDLPDSRKDVLEVVRRGDIFGSSFAFEVLSEEWRKDGKREIRQIQEVRLHDVGPVTFPAYRGTTVAARMAENPTDARASYDAYRERVRRKISQVLARAESI